MADYIYFYHSDTLSIEKELCFCTSGKSKRMRLSPIASPTLYLQQEKLLEDREFQIKMCG